MKLCRARQPKTYVGPVWDPVTKKQLLLCAYCDQSHPLVKAEIDPNRERDCISDELAGERLAAEGTTCLCFETDPFPTAHWPHKAAKHRRYFYYQAIATKLGVSGKNNRAQLPSCVVKCIAIAHPDDDGESTKVGYKQRR